jgi:hypothetical protein
MDADGNGISEAIYAVQGPIGAYGEVHRFEITSTSPFAYQPEDPLRPFPGPWFIATPKAMPSRSAPQSDPAVAPPVGVWTNPVNPYDVNDGGLVTPLDVLETINYINANPGQTALPAQQFSPPRFLDTNIDGRITPEDVLVVLNYLNGSAASLGEGESSEPWAEIAAIVKPWDLVASPAVRRNAPATFESRDQALGELGTALLPGTALVPGAKWFLPDAEDESPGNPESLPARKVEPNLFDLEAVLEEIAAEVAVPWRGALRQSSEN